MPAHRALFLVPIAPPGLRAGTRRALRACALATGVWLAPPCLADGATDPPGGPSTRSTGPSAAEPPAGAALPAEPRVILHTRDVGDTLADSLEAILRALEPAPERIETRFVDIGVDRDQVRYFHPGDAALAEAVAARLRPVFGELSVRDFGHFRPRPSAGLVELWVR